MKKEGKGQVEWAEASRDMVQMSPLFLPSDKDVKGYGCAIIKVPPIHEAVRSSVRKECLY